MKSLSEFPYSIGDGATVSVGSDRYPATIVQMLELPHLGVAVMIQYDNYRSVKPVAYGEDGEYEYTPNTENTRLIAIHHNTKSRLGWFVVSEERTDGVFDSCTPLRSVVFGKRRYYYDPHV